MSVCFMCGIIIISVIVSTVTAAYMAEKVNRDLCTTVLKKVQKTIEIVMDIDNDSRKVFKNINARLEKLEKKRGK